MPEMDAYAPGTPSWVDVGSRDIPATVAFYGGLFGWDTFEPPGGGGYTMFLQNDRRVAAVGPIMDPNSPEAWTTYVSVADADATAAAVGAAGGQVLAAPFDVMGAGRMGVFMDDTGAAFSVWQPNEMKGAGLVNEPVSLCWNELASPDPAKSARFYNAVFGWGADVHEGDMPYTEFTVDGRSIGGMMPLGPMHPPGTPPHWLVYFSVANTDATIVKTEELGGKALAPAIDIPIGRFAPLMDTRGAVFAVIQLAG